MATQPYSFMANSSASYPTGPRMDQVDAWGVPRAKGNRINADTGLLGNPYGSSMTEQNWYGAPEPAASRQSSYNVTPFSYNRTQANAPSAYTPSDIKAPEAFTPIGDYQNPKAWNDPATAQWMSAYIANVLPVNQQNSNDYWKGQELGTQNQQWAANFNETQYGNRFNQGLQAEQQALQNWQANEAAKQWAAQFGYTQQRDTQEFGLAQQAQNATEWYNQAQVAARNKEADIQRAMNEGTLSVQQGQLALAQVKQEQDNALATRAQGATEWYNQQNAALRGREAEINNAWYQGQLSNSARQTALAELTQQQMNAYNYARLANEQAIAGMQGQTARDVAGMQGQTARDVAGMQGATDREVAAMQAYGRTQRPNARWLRNWG